MSRLLLVVVLGMIGCPDAGSRPPADATTLDADAGSDTAFDAIADTSRSDAIPQDGHQDVDAAIEAGPIDCSEISGLRRCDRCPDRCPVGQTCRDVAGVCAPRETDGCDVSAFPGGGEVCSNGSPCAGRWTGSTFGGLCVTPAFCLASRDAGLPFEACLYPDGTTVVTGPPDAACPPSSDPRAPFCGGACEATCPPGELLGAPIETMCLGLSETRGYGVCAFSVVFCHEGFAHVFNCDENYGEPCACMVLRPQPETPPEAPQPLGYFVMASACVAYRDYHPDSVECFDQNWRPL